MRISGETDRAEQLLQEMVKRAPEAVGARLNLAADLLQEERAAEALTLLDGAEAPNDPLALRHLRLQQALALLQLGSAAEAREVLDELMRLGPTPPSLAPLMHWRLALLALAEGDRARACEEAERMEAALAEHGSGRRSGARHHGAVRSRQILVGARRAEPRFRPLGRGS